MICTSAICTSAAGLHPKPAHRGLRGKCAPWIVSFLPAPCSSRLTLHSFLWLLVAAFLLPCIRPAQAHDIALSGVNIVRGADGRTLVSVVTHESRLAAANPDATDSDATNPDATDPDAAIRKRLKLRFDGQDFVPGKAHLSFDKANDLVTWQATHPARARKIEVLQPLYPEDPAARFTVLVYENGQVSHQALLTAASPRFSTAPAERPGTWSVVSAYFQQGIVHIFGGPDHVCFVLGLLLLGGTVGSLLKTVTAFTLAHSVTLSAAVLGLWSPSPRLVEPLIALSIVIVALENLRYAPGTHGAELKPETGASPEGLVARDWRPVLAFGFGLVHGFGFAGALRELGLPSEALGPALASFNFGVEAGQACIVLVVAPLLAALARRSARGHRAVVVAGSLAIAALGLWWFGERIGLVG